MSSLSCLIDEATNETMRIIESIKNIFMNTISKNRSGRNLEEEPRCRLNYIKHTSERTGAAIDNICTK